MDIRVASSLPIVIYVYIYTLYIKQKGEVRKTSRDIRIAILLSRFANNRESSSIKEKHETLQI